MNVVALAVLIAALGIGAYAAHVAAQDVRHAVAVHAAKVAV